MAVTINASTSSGLVTTADNSGLIAFQTNGTQFNPLLTAGTSQASTSGTAILFTGIPSWAKRVTVMFNGVKTSSSGIPLLQIGSGSVTSSGYASSGTSGSSSANSTSGFILAQYGATANLWTGQIIITNLTGNTWVAFGIIAPNNNTNNGSLSSGVVSLSGALDRVNITTNSTDTFTAGSINIMYE